MIIPPESEWADRRPLISSAEFLGTRAFNCVMRLGPEASSLQGVAAFGRTRVKLIPNLGRKSLEEIDHALEVNLIEWADTAPSRGVTEPSLVLDGDGSAIDTPPAEMTGQVPAKPKSVRKAVSEIVDEGSRLEGSVFLNLARTLRDRLATDLTVPSRSIDVIYSRMVSGETLETVGKRQGVTRERVRQLANISRADLERFRDDLGKAYVSEWGRAVRTRFLEGESLDTLVEPLAGNEFGFSKQELKGQALRYLLCERDLTINRALSGSNLRSRRITVRQRFSDELILGALRTLGQRAGRIPTHEEYDLWRRKDEILREFGGLPSVPLLQQRFGSWNSALAEAGFDVEIRGPRSDRRWDSRSCEAVLLRLVDELERLPSCQEYDAIAEARRGMEGVEQLPSSATVRNRMGEVGLGRWEDLRSHLVLELVSSGRWT